MCAEETWKGGARDPEARNRKQCVDLQWARKVCGRLSEGRRKGSFQENKFCVSPVAFFLFFSMRAHVAEAFNGSRRAECDTRSALSSSVMRLRL